MEVTVGRRVQATKAVSVTAATKEAVQAVIEEASVAIEEASVAIEEASAAIEEASATTSNERPCTAACQTEWGPWART